MKLSIVTINFNNRNGLAKTIRSVINQSSRDFEWIIIDGGSTDGSRELIEAYKDYVTYWVSEPDSGIYNAMNKGIKASHGEYIQFLNSGDSLLYDDVVESFLKLPYTEAIISGNIVLDGSIHNVRYSPDENEIDYEFLHDRTVLHPSSYIKRSLFEQYGDYDESLKIVSDWKFFLICLIKNNCSYRKWDRCIVDFSSDGISSSPDFYSLMEDERTKVLESVFPRVNRSFERQRKQIALCNSQLDEPFGIQIGRFLFRCFRKISSCVCSFFLKSRYQLRLHNRTEGMLVVSMTSWTRRIDNVGKVIASILNNTVLPDRIVLNLSEEEFPDGVHVLPDDLKALIQSGVLEVLWTKGNLRAFKKFIPTLKKYPDCVVITIDDDFEYPVDFIETFISRHKELPNHPLSGNQFKINGAQAHCGCASLVKSEFFGKYLDELMDDRVLEIGMDDVFYTFCAALNGVSYEYVGKLFFTNMRPINPVDGLSESAYEGTNDEMTQYLVSVMRKRFHIDATKLHKPFFVW